MTTTRLPESPLLWDDDELLVRDTVARVADGHREHRDDRSTWNALVELGFTTLRCADEHGGSVGRVSETLIVVEELARVFCGAPIVSAAVLAPELLRRAGMSADQTNEIAEDAPLSFLISGDLAGLSTSAEVGIAWDAGLARRAIGVDRDRLYVADLGDAVPTPDVTRTARRASGAPTFVGTVDAEAIADVERLARLAVVADGLGLAGEMLSSALAYADERIQFGVPIGSFQAVQHLLAEAFVCIDSLRSAFAYAVWAAEGGNDDRDHAADVAKAYANDVCMKVINTATQVYGGIAVTWEHDGHRRLRRAVANRVLFGDTELLLARLGRGEEI